MRRGAYFDFIPILEETGLIREVGRWALRKAIADHLRWRAAALPAVLPGGLDLKTIPPQPELKLAA